VATPLPALAGAAHELQASPLNAAEPPAPGARFVAAGAVFGAAGPGADVILQARKSTSLVVRGAGGAIYFARLLNPGEAWRASSLAGLTADVGDPGAMEVFVGGLSRGRLSEPLTPLSHLGQS
jgi:hypothetical protein